MTQPPFGGHYPRSSGWSQPQFAHGFQHHAPVPPTGGHSGPPPRSGEPPPDPAERLAAMRDRLARAFPGPARWLGYALNLLTWTAIPLLLLNLLLIPETRQALPVYLGVFTMAIQLGLLLRSRGVTLKSFLTMVSVSALWAPVIFAVQLVIMGPLGWTAHDRESSVWIAAPTEEVLKLVPLFAVLIFARNRAARFGIADHILLGAACGVGFGLTENIPRALNTPSLVAVFDTQHEYSLFTLFPGWVDSISAESAGHAVWGALVAGGIGIARRYGPVLWSPLPLALLAWVTLDHMAWNDQTSHPELLPEELQFAHELLGSGFAARPALLALVVLAVWLDYRTLGKVHAQLPPMPLKGPSASSRSPWALFAVLAELRLMSRALWRSPSLFPQAMGFVRERRELGYGLHRAAGGPRRNLPRRGPLLAAGWSLHTVLTRALFGAMTVCTVLAGAALWQAAVGPPDSSLAFLAPQLENLANFWNGLSAGEQLLLTLGGTALLMLLPGVGFMAALGAASTGAAVAASGREIAEVVRDPASLLARHSVGSLLVGGAVWLAGSRVPGVRVNPRLFSRPSTRSNHDLLVNGGGLEFSQRTVQDYAQRAGVGLEGVTVQLLSAPDDIRYLDSMGGAAFTSDGTIYLGPASFQDEETLVRTLGHERMHVWQEQIHGPPSSAMLPEFERTAYASEDMFWNHFRTQGRRR